RLPRRPSPTHRLLIDHAAQGPSGRPGRRTRVDARGHRRTHRCREHARAHGTAGAGGEHGCARDRARDRPAPSRRHGSGGLRPGRCARDDPRRRSHGRLGARGLPGPGHRTRRLPRPQSRARPPRPRPGRADRHHRLGRGTRSDSRVADRHRHPPRRGRSGTPLGPALHRRRGRPRRRLRPGLGVSGRCRRARTASGRRNGAARRTGRGPIRDVPQRRPGTGRPRGSRAAGTERGGHGRRTRSPGIVIAAVAAWFLPVDTVLSGAAGRAEAAYQSAAVGAVPAVSESVDHLAAALILGSVAGVTPFLIRVDVLVHRLPDRLVYPLIGICFAAAALASFLGSSLVWSSALIIGTVATLAFAAIHLLGRVLGARTMGLGDVKLAFIVFSTSALYHPWAAAVVLVVMMVIAGVWALIGAVRARRLHGVNIAFGPAMLSGMWLG